MVCGKVCREWCVIVCLHVYFQAIGLPRPQLAGMKQGRLSRTLDNNSPPSPSTLTQGATPHPNSTLGGAESDMMPPPPNVLHCMSDMLPRAPAPPPAALNPANVITTSIDEGVEADILDRDSEAAAHSSRFAALQRDPYGLGLLPEYGYGYRHSDSGSNPGVMHRQSLSSANSSSSLNAAGLAGVMSPFTSFDSSLEVDMVSGGGGGDSRPESTSSRVLSTHHMLPGGAVPMTSISNHSPYLQVRLALFLGYFGGRGGGAFWVNQCSLWRENNASSLGNFFSFFLKVHVAFLFFLFLCVTHKHI